MIKYVDHKVTFSEVPDEVTFCINISGCINNCPGCHSPYLADDIGWELNKEVLENLIDENDGITCVCLMGGDINPSCINRLAKVIKDKGLKSAWYSGNKTISYKINLFNFDYIKIGPYIKEKGPLNNPNTNQKMYKINIVNNEDGKNVELEDITYKFWK